LGPLQASQIAAQLVFRSEDHDLDRRKSPVQGARNLGVSHSLVVTQKEWKLIFFRQANQLFPYLTVFFPAQNLGQWRGSRIVRDFSKVGFIGAGIQLAPSSSQLIDAMPTCHLRDPRPERESLVFCPQNPVQLQKNLCRCILSIFRAPKEPSTDPQDVAMVLYVECA